MQKRAQQMRQQMAEKEHELGLMNQEIARLREEVQSKAQQVKQYKKQADKYRQEMEPFVQQGVMQKEQVSAASLAVYMQVQYVAIKFFVRAS